MKCLGLYHLYIKIPQCGYIEHGLEYITFYNKNPCGFFDTDLPQVSWHFTVEWVLSSTDRVKIIVKEAIRSGLLLISHT